MVILLLDLNQIFFNGISPAMKRDFKRWLLEGNMFIDKDKYFIGDEMCMNYIIQYENLAQGIQEVCERLDIPFEPARIPRFKVSNRPKKSYSAYYDQETIDLVTKLFEFEVKLFNYQP
jgi:hypothetical protein